MLGRYLLHRLDTEPASHPGPHSELSGSFGAHVLGANELLWLFPSLLESWCSREAPADLRLDEERTMFRSLCVFHGMGWEAVEGLKQRGGLRRIPLASG